jgi:hypothetical protein
MLIHPSKQAPLARGRQEGWDEAREAYLLKHAPGLKEHYAASKEPSTRSRRMRATAIPSQVRRT